MGKEYLTPSDYFDRTMRACRLHAIGDFRTDEVRVPRPAGEQLLLRVEACGVCGSDIPRIFRLGTSKQRYPLTIGHEFGGEVVAVGADADEALVGQRGAVFPCIPCGRCDACRSADYALCEDYDYLGSRSDGGFAEYCLVPSPWHLVPTSSPTTTGEMLALVEPCTVAQHAVRRGDVRAGASVLVLGAGPIGIMAARWAELFGAGPVVLSEVVDEKVEFARDLGLTVVNSAREDLGEAFRSLTGGQGADVVIEGTGTGAALGQGMECARTFGTVVLLGNPVHDTTVTLAQHSAVLRKELMLRGVWNSHYAANPINEWRYTVRMMDEGRMRVSDLVTHRCGLGDLPRLCADIAERRTSVCKALCVPGEDS